MKAGGFAGFARTKLLTARPRVAATGTGSADRRSSKPKTNNNINNVVLEMVEGAKREVFGVVCNSAPPPLER
jgi:hypothetical protein